MEIRNWLVTGALTVVFPVWIGSIWSCFAGLKGRMKNLLFSWVAGFLTVMAVSQLILVPLILRRYTFADYCSLAAIIYAVLALAAAVLIRKRQMGRKWRAIGGKWTIYQVLFTLGAVFLIFVQAYIAGAYQHIDDDDSRFVVEQVLAVENGAMYTQNPVTGNVSYWDMGEVRKDMISPWAMLLAFWSRLSGIAPAMMCHKYLPFFLILLCYAVYALIAMNLFRDDREKTGMFLIFVSALHIYGYFSTHTISAVMLLRIWQGKAMVGAMLLPAMCFVMYEIMSRREKKMWYLLAAVCAAAAALASGSGITATPLLVGVCGIAELIHEKNWKTTILMWCTAIPSIIYLLCYLFFWQLLKVYF